jgi:hypothetical protein
VVTLYLFPEANIALRPRLLAELAPGTRLVSNSFDMGDWTPDGRAQGRTSGGALLWVIPAPVAGVWTLDLDGGRARLEIDQHYQMLDVRLAVDGVALPVEDARLRGTALTVVGADPDRPFALHGRVNGSRLTGTVQLGETVHAVRGHQEPPGP